MRVPAILRAVRNFPGLRGLAPMLNDADMRTRPQSPLLSLLSLAACLAAGAAQAAPLPLGVQRVLPPATVTPDGGKKTQLLPKRALNAGDRITTGRNGRVALQLDRNGVIVIGDDTELFIHSVDAAQGDEGALARLALIRGSVRLDVTPRAGLPVQDLRLNLGLLRLRAHGAEIWANAEPGLNQTVCLLQGTVDIASDNGEEHLEKPGDCFRYGYNNISMRLRPESDDVLSRKLARTAFAGERPAGRPPVAVATPVLPPSAPPTPLIESATAPAPQPDATLAQAAPALPPSAPAAAMPVESAPEASVAVAETPATAPVAEASAALPPPAADSTAVATGAGWTVVVGSFKNEAAARRESARLIDQGLPSSVQVAGDFYRVTIGRFAARDAARRHADLLRQTNQLKGWVAEAR